MRKIRNLRDFNQDIWATFGDIDEATIEELFSIDNIPNDYLEIKNWGAKYNLISNSFFSVDICWMVEGGFTSYHEHQHKWNIVNVIAGSLLIKRDRDDKDPYITEIGPKKSHRRFEFPPNYHHSLEALDHTVFVEIDVVKCYKDDIFRKDEGGIRL